MAPIAIIKTGIEIVSGIGIDTMITAAAKQIIPQSYGLFGLAQKACVKIGSIGLSLVAGKAITNTLDQYIDEIKTIAEELEAEESE